MTNCPNCGAPITKGTCEYCGTVFVDPLICWNIPYKEQTIQLEQEILRLQNDILLSDLRSDAIISLNTWKKFLK